MEDVGDFAGLGVFVDFTEAKIRPPKCAAMVPGKKSYKPARKKSA